MKSNLNEVITGYAK
jgi:Ca2+ transporting ATPase